MKLVRFGDRRTGLVVDLEAMWGSAPRPVASPSQHGLKSAKDSTSGWMKLGVQVIARPTATESLHHKLAAYRTADALVREALTPAVSAARAEHTSLLETRGGVRQAIALVERISDLRSRRMDAESALGTSGRVTDERPGLPPASVRAFSAAVETLLDRWRFPHEKPVYFDERSQDLILGARRRGEQGKGLRALTHAAFSIGLLQTCRVLQLPAVGFVILDSPLVTFREAD